MRSPADRRAGAGSRLRRAVARLGARLLVGLTAVVDAGPSLLRFGKGRDLREWLFRVPLPSLPESVVGVGPRPEPVVPAPVHTTVILVTRTLGTGGVEAVVATLARQLPRHGVGVFVLCERGGATADALRRDGVVVIEAGNADAAKACTSALPNQAVAQLHNAPEHLIEACLARRYPVVPVIHTTDVNLSPAAWELEAHQAAQASVTIAVSETVREFYLRHLPQADATPVIVVPNGVDVAEAPTQVSAEDRAELARVLGSDLTGAIVFVCLARYELQKNIPGLVASFLAAADTRHDLHLVVAGPVEDWLEHRLADLLRRAHPAHDRVHLMGVSSSRRLLACADAFIIDAFFEGGPLALTEALVAGIPAVAADVGVAREQVGTDGQRGFVVPNPAMPLEATSFVAIRRARVRPHRQRNRRDLVDAVLSVAESMSTRREQRATLAATAQAQLSTSSMLAAHAEILGAIARDRRQYAATRSSGINKEERR